jgi:hypothetical protein
MECVTLFVFIAYSLLSLVSTSTLNTFLRVCASPCFLCNEISKHKIVANKTEHIKKRFKDHGQRCEPLLRKALTLMQHWWVESSSRCAAPSTVLLCGLVRLHV